MAPKRRLKTPATQRKKNKSTPRTDVPTDTVAAILQRCPPTTLFRVRLVCSEWYWLIRERRETKRMTWLVSSPWIQKTKKIKRGWIYMYNPILNIQDKVSFEIPETPEWKYLDILPSSKNEVLLVTYGTSLYWLWNPVSGLVYKGLDIGHSHAVNYEVTILKRCFEVFEDGKLIGVMPDDMWERMYSDMPKDVVPNVTQTEDYYLIWSRQRDEHKPEMVVVFVPDRSESEKKMDKWSWIDNTWHASHNGHGCMWCKLSDAVTLKF